MNAKSLLVFLSIATSFALAQSPKSIVYYDTFSQPRINASKWIPTVPQVWGNPLEVVREIRDGQLRLTLRNVGNTDSNSGWQWAQNQLYFVNPGTIHSVTSDITVKKARVTQCAANTDTTSGIQVQIGGEFFNTGTGGSGQDVRALVIVGPNMPDQGDLVAGLWWGTIDGTLGLWTTIGEYQYGQRLTAKVTWDKVNRKFTGSIVANGAVNSVDARYAVSDTTPAAAGTKALMVENSTTNCIGFRTSAETEALFDNVAINQ
jgi:hypothetical protein